MISFVKNLFVVGVIIGGLCLLSVAVNELHSGEAVRRPEYAIPVPHNSRPVLAPCDMVDDDLRWVDDLERAWRVRNVLGALAEFTP